HLDEADQELFRHSQPALFMIDSSRRSDLFRRYGVSAPLRCALASPSSRFLASAKNLCRRQPDLPQKSTLLSCQSPSLRSMLVFRPGDHE
ncbi:MAG TPA: hypothetical protein VJ776_01105, partial [Thermoanaerobaculia bacterium]|nr:hypothetical protein [Thermoanaerobaculia bacterium]